jgi:hypothetical protein
MYYRRKVLLALIEVFGGSLESRDCETLLFHFCQQTGNNHYDFFPRENSPGSFVLDHDRQRLIELGLLKQVDGFQLRSTHSYLNELTPADQSDLLKFKSAIGNLRGDQLLQKTHHEFPEFTSRNKADTKPVVFSAGYEGLTIDAFLDKLIQNNVSLVVDVRNNPHSMKYGFSKKMFKGCIEEAGMRYIHIPELGIPSAIRKGLGKSLSYAELFKVYERQILPEQEAAISQLFDLTQTNERIAIVCFEANPHSCHRLPLIKHLQQNKAFKRTVIHL